MCEECLYVFGFIAAVAVFIVYFKIAEIAGKFMYYEECELKKSDDSEGNSEEASDSKEMGSNGNIQASASIQKAS